MKTKKTIAAIACCAIAALAFSGCAKKAEEVKPVELKMSVTTSDSSTWVAGANKFAELVAARSGGKVTIKVFPNEQLSGGNMVKGIEMMQQGVTDISMHSNIIYSSIDQRFGVVSLPWLFTDESVADAKLAGPAGQKIKDLLLEKGIVGLAFGENGFRQITNSKREIKTPKDMVGLKLRVPAIKMFISLYKLLGADPTAMNFGEVFTALQQKTIDGQENPVDTIFSAKFQEVQKYISLWNYAYDCTIIGINKAKFDTFDKATQDMLKAAAEEAMAYQRQINRERSADQIKAFEEKGMVVTKFDAAMMKPFQEKIAPVYTEYEPIIGKDLIDLFRN